MLVILGVWASGNSHERRHDHDPWDEGCAVLPLAHYVTVVVIVAAVRDHALGAVPWRRIAPYHCYYPPQYYLVALDCCIHFRVHVQTPHDRIRVHVHVHTGAGDEQDVLLLLDADEE